MGQAVCDSLQDVNPVLQHLKFLQECLPADAHSTRMAKDTI
jgi:hypothetical protein